MRICPNCNAENDDNNSVCFSCNKPLIKSETNELEKEMKKRKISVSNTNLKSILPVIIICVISVIVALAIIFVLFRGLTPVGLDKAKETIVVNERAQKAPRPDISDEGIKSFIASYNKSRANAVNTGDFRLISDYFPEGSHLSAAQEKQCEALFLQGTTYEFIAYSVDSIEWDGTHFKVKATESYMVSADDKAENKIYKWTYILSTTPKLGIVDIASY